MCGIAGTTSGGAVTAELLRQGLVHRGPDDSGIWNDAASSLALAHLRLAVIDLSPRGHQPMLSDCGRYVIVFNGEIYNYQALRAELEAHGETFRSDSDTEVLLILLRREGIDALTQLVGMFAFALWDRKRRELLLVRDRLGVKPLVYAELPGGHLAFASEIAALRRHPGIDLSLDRDALSEYLACLYVPAPRSIYKGIRTLLPGSWLRWCDGAVTSGVWWKPTMSGSRRLSLADATEELTPIVRRAVIDRLVSDVPLGCFLSSGTDSAVVAAIMSDEARRRGGAPVRSFTMTFDDPLYDEREGAASIARALGTDHTEIAASPDLVGFLDEAIHHFGEPFGNPTALLIHDLSRRARQHVTVALVGDGGDETFAGYPRYAGGVLAEKYRLMPHWFRRCVGAAAGSLIPDRDGGHGWRRAREFLAAGAADPAEAYAAWVEYFDPRERGALLDDVGAVMPSRPIAELYRTAASRSPLDAMQETDLRSFLPFNVLSYGDAMSMWHALELRHPLLDHRLIEAVGRLAPELRLARGLKTLLKAIARQLLPPSLVGRPKRGFNPPIGRWIRQDLAPIVHERLHPRRLADLGIAAGPVRRLLDEHRSGTRDHGLKLWGLVTLEAWMRSQDVAVAR
jgi:asparagine synthase (glutamine-hydrolysing)